LRERQRANLVRAIEGLREELKKLRPEDIAERCGIAYDGEQRRFTTQLLRANYTIGYPDFVVYELDGSVVSSTWTQGLIAYYLHTADGMPLAGEWVSLRHFPDGLFYQRAFQGYAGDKLALALGNDLARFLRAGEALGGQREEMGDAAFSFRALPRVPLAVVYWLGDEELPPSAQVLFDASADHYLPIDGLTGLGARLCGMILEVSKPCR